MSDRYELINNDSAANYPQEESFPGYIGRNAARTVARAGESIVGLPGDIASGALGLGSYLTNNAIPNYEQVQNKNLISFPTSQQVKENVTKPLTGEYLEPQDPYEEGWDEIVDTAAPFLLGSVPKTAVEGAKIVGKALGTSAVGNFSKWFAESVGASPLVAEGTKIGSMFLTGILGTRKSIDKARSKYYSDALSNIPDNTKFDISPEKRKIGHIIQGLEKRSFDGKSSLVDKLKTIYHIPNDIGKTALQDVIKLKQDWNGYFGDLSKEGSKILNEAVGILNNKISSFGAKNPSFYEPYKIGEELTKGLKSTNYAQKILSNSPEIVQKAAKNKVVQHIIGGGSLVGTALNFNPYQIAAGVGGITTAHEGLKAIQLMYNSPVARKLYADAMKSLLNKNYPSYIKSISKLDDVADKFDYDDIEEKRYELVS